MNMKSLSQEQRLKIDSHLRLVLSANERVNLTRITSWEQAQLLHIEDSLSALEEMEEAADGPFADMGSGAGYPGIPLAIATGRKATLVESVSKKAKCLQEFTKKLAINEQVYVYNGRVEELSDEGPGYAVVTARALAAIASLMELASPLLIEGGRLICYKSEDVDEELEQAIGIQEKLALYLKSDRCLTLSDGCTHRRIIVFEKHGNPTVNLPRVIGKAQKNPYRA